MDEVTRSDRLLKFAVEQLFVPIRARDRLYGGTSFHTF